MNGYVRSLLAPQGSQPYWSSLGMGDPYPFYPFVKESKPKDCRNVADDPVYRGMLAEAMRQEVVTPELAAFRYRAMRNSDEAIAWNKRQQEVQEDWSI